MDTKLFVERGKGGMFTVLDRSFVAGKVRWVDSGKTTAGADTAGKGKNPQFPFLTLDYAIGQMTLDQGDVVMLAPGHAETLGGTDVTLDIAGLHIIGQGIGDNRPTFTFSDAADEFNVTAANITIENCRFVSTVNSLVNFFDVDEEHLTLINCEFVTGSATEALCFINLATTKDYITLKGCRVLQPFDPAGTSAAAGTGFLFCVDSEHILMEDCIIDGFFETAIVHNRTTKCLDLVIRNCTFNQELSDGVHLILVADVTGVMERSTGRNVNATDVAVANIVGTIGTKFWLSSDSSFGNDSGGGQLMVGGDAAAT